MRAFVMAIAVLAFLAGPAMAGQCPLLIKQLNAAVEKMMADDAKVKEAKAMIADAQKLHEGGKHADSVKKCDDAAKLLGVKLEKKS